MHTRRVRILLVEADPKSRKAFVAALEAGGIDCMVVESGSAAEAASLLVNAQDRFDLVAVSLDLPGTYGLDLFAQTKDLEDPPSFIVTCGAETIGQAAAALKQGADDYLLKDPPLAYQSLLPLVVQEVMERRENRRFRRMTEHDSSNARQILEKEVRRRTAQLMRTNRRLRQEIDERKRLEEDLRLNEQQFTLLMEHFPGMVYLKDEQSRFLYLNRYLEDVYGIRVDACIGRTDRDIWPTEISDALMEDDRKVLASGKELQKIEDIRLGDFQASFFTQKFPIFQNNSPGLIGGVSIDITDYRSTEQENRLLVSAVEHAAESVLILDSQERIIYINHAGERSLQIPRNDLKGKPYEMFFAPDRGAEKTFSLKELGDRPWRGTIRRDGADGDQRELDVVVSPLEDESGAITNYAVIELDVTEEKAMQKALERKQRMEALGMLAGGIAHDFINILQPVIINAELISDMLPPDAPEQEFIGQIIEASRIGREITNQIKMFGSRRKQIFAPVVLDMIVREALTIIRRSLPETITLRQRISARGTLVRTDATQIYQLLANLCTNAVQAMESSRGALCVSLSETSVTHAVPAIVSDLMPGTYAKLVVRDTGCGISPEIMDQIFDPLFTTRKSSTGTGLGLGVAHSVVKNAGGSIIVHSTPGKGTLFEVYLPASSRSPELKVSEASPAAGRKKGRVLLVDDNVLELRSVHRMLVRQGFRVSSTHDAVKALKLFKETPKAFDLVITDELMPLMRGSEMAAVMREVRRDLPVIICSGSEKALEEIRSEAAVFPRLLSKPFSSEILREAIEQALGRGGFTFS